MTSPLTGVDALDAQRLQLIANTVPALLAYVDERGALRLGQRGVPALVRLPARLDPRPARSRDQLGEVAWSMLEPHVTRAIAGENVSFEATSASGPVMPAT